MNTARRHVAIVGGGTAGWLAALMLRRAKPDPTALRVSVIESPDIPTVGVGEGSTSIFQQVLLDLGMDEAAFIAQTGATLKFEIKHCGWRKDGKDYFGPFNDPNALRPAPEGLPHVEEQLHLPVMDGLGLLQKAASKTVLVQPNTRAAARQTAKTLETEFKSAAARATSHNAYLSACAQRGN